MAAFGPYVFGLVLATVSLAPIVIGAWRLRDRSLPGWEGIPARVAEALLSLGLLVLALEVAGVLGGFTRVGVVAACVVSGAVAWILAGRLRSAAPGQAADPLLESRLPWQRTVAAGAVALVGAPWLGWTFYAFAHGPQRVDSLWYHLPTAARFAQLGSILHLQYFDANPVTVFYPAATELLHGFGILLFGNDLLSPGIDLGWAVLALAAAWSLGRPFQRAPHCTVAAALVLGTPGLIDTQPGGAYNDIACIALVLAAAAMLGGSHGRRTASLPAAVAAGLAFGTKFTMIVPVVALAGAAVLIAPRGGRTRRLGLWLLVGLALGGVWYLRNLFLVGNPLPSLGLHLGPLSLPSPSSTTANFSVADYLFNARVWRDFFIPGLRRSLGPGWTAMLGIAAAGMLLGLLARRDRRLQLLGAVAAITGIAFIVSPQALGVPGAPVFFVFNVRYAAPAMALGLALFAATAGQGRARRGDVYLAVAALLLLITELDPGVWPTGLSLQAFDRPIHGGSALLGVVVAGSLLLAQVARIWSGPRRTVRWARSRPAASLASAAGAAVLVAAGGALAHSYSIRRYRSTPPLPGIYRWAQGIHHARIAVVGFTEQYPLYGADASSYVQYIGEPRPHHGYAAISICRAWRAAVDTGRYRWIVVAPAGFPLGHGLGPEVGWTLWRSQAKVVIAERPVGVSPDQLVVLLRLNAPLNPGGCPSR